MDFLNKSFEELDVAYWEAHKVMMDATEQFTIVAEAIKEKRRLEDLKAKLGNVSAADLELLKNSIALGVETISSEESAIQ